MNTFWYLWRPFHTVHFDIPVRKDGVVSKFTNIEQMAVSMISYQHRILRDRYLYEFSVIINGEKWFIFTHEMEQGDTTR